MPDHFRAQVDAMGPPGSPAGSDSPLSLVMKKDREHVMRRRHDELMIQVLDLDIKKYSKIRTLGANFGMIFSCRDLQAVAQGSPRTTTPTTWSFAVLAKRVKMERLPCGVTTMKRLAIWLLLLKRIALNRYVYVPKS